MDIHTHTYTHTYTYTHTHTHTHKHIHIHIHTQTHTLQQYLPHVYLQSGRTPYLLNNCRLSYHTHPYGGQYTTKKTERSTQTPPATTYAPHLLHSFVTEHLQSRPHYIRTIANSNKELRNTHFCVISTMPLFCNTHNIIL